MKRVIITFAAVVMMVMASVTSAFADGQGNSSPIIKGEISATEPEYEGESANDATFVAHSSEALEAVPVSIEFPNLTFSLPERNSKDSAYLR